MRIKSLDDIKTLGLHARKQIEAALDRQIVSQKKDDEARQHPLKNTLSSVRPPASAAGKKNTKKAKPARVMRTHDGLTYCPCPSTDPFVAVFQRLEAKYGMYDQGGMILTELIIEGGAHDWRFDIALISPFSEIDVNGQKMQLGYACLVEADGFSFHRSKEAFKNDRAKQTHALKNGFPVKRITNEDARTRLDEVIADIEQIFSQPKLYERDYTIKPKGLTQFVLAWINTNDKK